MGRSRQTGFTMIELMVVVTIMGILLAVAIPNFESFVNSNRLSSAANEMVASIQTARMESLRRNRRAVVCLSQNPSAASPACNAVNATGWVAFLDPDSSGTFTVGDTLLRSSTLKDRVVVNSSLASAGKVVFRSDGLARNSTGGAVQPNVLLNGALDVCISTTRPVLNARHVCVGSGSRVSVRQFTNAGCAATPVNNACDTP